MGVVAGETFVGASHYRTKWSAPQLAKLILLNVVESPNSPPPLSLNLVPTVASIGGNETAPILE